MTPLALAAIGLGLILAAVGAASITGFKVFNFSPARPQSGPAASQDGSALAAGSDAKFQYLAAQSTNSCGLQADTVMGYADSVHIQGACCNPMVMDNYRAQVQGLQQFAEVPAIPKDPYDIPASLANQLLGYDRSIKLSSSEQAVFDQAMTLTPDKAPCCCKCWRWYAHEGLAKYLIQQQHWSASQVGHVVTLINACGGKRDVATRDGPGTG